MSCFPITTAGLGRFKLAADPLFSIIGAGFGAAAAVGVAGVVAAAVVFVLAGTCLFN